MPDDVMDDDGDLIDEDDDDEIYTCWCGATGTWDELFDDVCLEENCGGGRELHCYCGGDLCVCHHHGSTECPGCEDCEPDDYGEFDNEGQEDREYD